MSQTCFIILDTCGPDMVYTSWGYTYDNFCRRSASPITKEIPDKIRWEGMFFVDSYLIIGMNFIFVDFIYV